MTARDETNEYREKRVEGEGNLGLMERLSNQLQPAMMPLVERMLVPDSVIRFGMRKLLASTLTMVEFGGDVEKQGEYLASFMNDLKTRNIAEQTSAANDQHYEVPAEFFKLMLGPYLKYSSGYWPSDKTTLEESEIAMLEIFCSRAGLGELAEGSRVLDLGCGWGSLTLYAAPRYPHLTFVSVSNSNSQRDFIESRCKELNVSNVTVKTSDINDLELEEGFFDRVMSVEMFEHMKNYERLLYQISTWLKPEGKLMVHIFVHDRFPYHFEEGSWMADRFFTGGTMPSKDLFLHFNEHMRVERQWAVNGVHYSKTLEAWLKKMDETENKAKIMKMFKEVYGEGNELKQFQEWRLFNMACSELFAYNEGNEWYVEHYLFSKTEDAKPLENTVKPK